MPQFQQYPLSQLLPSVVGCWNLPLHDWYFAAFFPIQAEPHIPDVLLLPDYNPALPSQFADALPLFPVLIRSYPAALTFPFPTAGSNCRNCAVIQQVPLTAFPVVLLKQDHFLFSKPPFRSEAAVFSWKSRPFLQALS